MAPASLHTKRTNGLPKRGGVVLVVVSCGAVQGLGPMRATPVSLAWSYASFSSLWFGRASGALLLYKATADQHGHTAGKMLPWLASGK